MYDRRVARGSTYAAMVIPAGTNPDAMMMDKKQDTMKKKSFQKSATVSILTTTVILNLIIGGNSALNTYKEYLPKQRHSHTRTSARETSHGCPN